MNWTGKRVLVTGAGGFIGSHLTERLVELGTNVRVFVRYNSRNDLGLIELLPHVIQKTLEIVRGDLKDPDAVRKAVKDQEVIFHLGALIAIPYSYVHPMDFVQTNILGTTHILAACQDYEIEKLVYTSTSEVYGTAQYTPINEEHPLRGQSPYSASKIGADKLAESYHRAFRLPVAILRPFNTFGPRQSARAVIPTIISQALSSGEVRLGSLHPTRDLLYVQDTVEGFIKIAESMAATGEVINVGSGKEISIGKLASKILQILGKPDNIVIDETRVRPENSEVERLICDYSKAKRLLNWEPKVPLDEGLKRTIEWITGHMNRYKVDRYNV
ncbi:MAG: GDP-mannose 4,6-dehydratase [Thermodesulfobacteriota bacterium]|nr:GDP-mannose 4,6-dehydratase [Thermodesulfobacteriota bacterium]